MPKQAVEIKRRGKAKDTAGNTTASLEKFLPSAAFGACRRIQSTGDTLYQALPAGDGQVTAVNASVGKVAAAADDAVPHQLG